MLIIDLYQCQLPLINLDLLILALAMMVRVMGNLFQVFAGEENLIWLLRQTQLDV